MKSNIIEEVLQKKKYYDEEEHQLNRKKETLEESKKILEADSIDTQSIDIAIKSYKEKIEKVKESRKKLAAILKTMKSGKTKIKNRVNKIVKINEEIAIIKENLEKLKKQNNNEKTNEEFAIWDKKLEEKTRKLMHEYKIIQGARTAKERAMQRYEALINGIPYTISKKKTKCRAKKTEKYKSISKPEVVEEVKPEVVEEVKPKVVEEVKPEVVEEVKPEVVEEVKPEVVEEVKPKFRKQARSEEIKRNKNKVKDISYITLFESAGKIEINGKVKNIDRHAYIDTEEEIKKVCKEVLNIGKIEQKIILSKIDYAIVNGIKDEIIGNYNSKRLNEEEIKQQRQEEYLRKLADYIKTIKSSEKYRLPFVLTYDCTGRISKKDYIKIRKYINVGEEIGAIVEGKRNLFIYREEVKPKLRKINLGFEDTVKRESGITKKIEGDKSFVPKVNTEYRPVSNVNLDEVTFLYQKNANKNSTNSQYDITL